ncbi:hypothetical protein [Micromonospora sp. SH-82]|uniref:hypothetical protein n=1 Tax=Micromonospora sp. SH-82 TaxID=3132938 RepID=UPI003EC098F2
MTFRVIKVLTERLTYHGWAWVRGYQLDDRGDAVATREIFVRPAGLLPAPRRGVSRLLDGGRDQVGRRE